MKNTFYQKVLEEYAESNLERTYLCWASETFKEVWAGGIKKRKKIVNHAQQFVKETEIDWCTSDIDSAFLFTFTHILGITDLQRREVRINFLEWAIKNNLDLEV